MKDQQDQPTYPTEEIPWYDKKTTNKQRKAIKNMCVALGFKVRYPKKRGTASLIITHLIEECSTKFVRPRRRRYAYGGFAYDDDICEPGNHPGEYEDSDPWFDEPDPILATGEVKD